MIEGEINVGGLDQRGNTLGGGVLELSDEIFVFGGGQALALRVVQEDVIAEQLDAGGCDGVHRRTGAGCWIGAKSRGPPEFLEGGQLDDETDRMGLEGDEG